MPRRPARVCPACNKVARGACCVPARAPDERASASQRGYGARWRRLRLLVLHRAPLCRECGRAATDVDHILPRRMGGTDDMANLQPLCHSCHSRKTARETTPGGGGYDL